MTTPKEPFWMIYGFGQGAPTMRHGTYGGAVREAHRLARQHAGVRFYVLQTVSCAVKSDVEFREIDYDARGRDDDGLPF